MRLAIPPDSRSRSGSVHLPDSESTVGRNEIVAIRITSASTKAGVVVSGMVLSVFLGFGAVFVAGEVGAVTAALAVTVALVVFCGRTFRGEGESVQQRRPAWKLSGGSVSSLVMVAVAYFFSALNLRRELKARRPA